MIALPANPDMERAVLGACLKDLPAFIHARQQIHTPEIFTEPNNRAIWKSLNRIFTRDAAIDAHLLYDDLLATGELADMGGVGYLAIVLSSVSTSAYIEPHVERLKQIHASRGLLTETATSLEHMGARASDIPEIAGELSESLDRLILQSGTQTGIVNYAKVQDKVLRNIMPADEAAVKGLSTGIEGIDQAFGILAGLYMLAGPKGHFKSATALSIARHRINENDEVVLWLGYEMPEWQTYVRFIGMDSGVANNLMVQGRTSGLERARIMQATHHGKINNLLHNTRNYEADEMIRHIIHQKSVHGDKLKMVVIDYLQLVPVRGIKRFDTAARAGALRDVQGQLKAITNEYSLNVWLLAGVSSDWVKYAWPEDDLLAECRSAHDPDVMMWMWNKQNHPGPSGEVDMVITKNRFGDDNMAIPLKYRKETMLIEGDPGRECKPREITTGNRKQAQGGSQIRTQRRDIAPKDVPF